MAEAGETTRVEVKSAWTSKINWTQAVGVAASVLTVVTGSKFNIPADQQLVIVGIIQGVQSLVTWVVKTWFTNTVTAASTAK